MLVADYRYTILTLLTCLQYGHPLTDDDRIASPRDPSLVDVGSIEVRISWVRLGRPKASFEGYEAHSRGLVHEKSKKLGAIHTVYVFRSLSFCLLPSFVCPMARVRWICVHQSALNALHRFAPTNRRADPQLCFSIPPSIPRTMPPMNAPGTCPDLHSIRLCSCSMCGPLNDHRAILLRSSPGRPIMAQLHSNTARPP